MYNIYYFLFISKTNVYYDNMDTATLELGSDFRIIIIKIVNYTYVYILFNFIFLVRETILNKYIV